MKCPVCTQEDLQVTQRDGVEIDFCTKCRGVWLDRGELDKIIERSADYAGPRGKGDDDDDDDDNDNRGRRSRARADDDDDDYRGRQSRPRDSDDDPRRRRRGFLSNLFDFD